MPYTKKEKKSNKKLVLIIAIVVTSIILAASGVFAYMMYQNDQEAQAVAAIEALPRIVVPEGHFTLTDAAPAELQKNKKTITLRAGVDLYTDVNADQATLEAEVDKVIKDIKSLDFNGIILDTRLNDSVVFASSALTSTPIDLLSIILPKALESELTVSVIYNLTGVKNIDGELIESYIPYANRQTIIDGLSELARYEIESVGLENYYTQKNGESFAEYQSYGSAGDYQTWLKDNVNSIIDEVISQAKLIKGTLPIGLNVSSVWANATTIEGGSPTKSDFEALTDGYADTKALVEAGMVDFIDVNIPTATKNTAVGFKTAVGWWGGICKTNAIPMYVTHSGESATSKTLPAWNGIDELGHQVLFASTSGNYYGSSFTGLSHLASDPEGSTAYLLKYFEGAIKEEDMLQDLKVISPTKQTTQTYEESIQFKMKYDPNAEVFLNGTKVEASSLGGASVWIPLDVGMNEIKMEHKGDTTTYKVERKIVIFSEVTPVGSMKVAGSSTIELTALAYKGSKISATINGTTIQLTEGGGGEDNDVESIYRVFQGTYTVPQGKTTEQSLGTVSYYGNYQGIYTGSATGATITIDKIADAVDPDTATGQVFTHATVTSRYANTYPFNTAGGYPQAIEYQLPQGTQDIVVSQNGDYLNLRSGKTIMRQTATLQDIPFAGNNPIAGMTVGVEGNDTVIRATMGWQSPFSINLSPYANYSTTMSKQNYFFNADTVTILLDYGTTLAPENFSGDMSSSPIFSGITHERVKNPTTGIWQYQITLPLRQTGRYYGAHATWENNTLVLKFNHPPTSTGSLSGVKIAVDAGHGGTDTGNLAGRDSIEKEVNLTMSFLLQATLQSLGAEVVMIRESDVFVPNPSKVDKAEAYGCDLYIAVHQNSSTHTAAYGAQTYYNAPFSQPLAQYIQASMNTVVPDSKWNYWNGSQGSFNFIVTRERQFPTVLVGV